MNLIDGVKTALSAAGKSQADLTDVFGVSPQAIANKQSRGTWSAKELIQIAKATGGKLLIEYPDGTKVAFTDLDE